VDVPEEVIEADLALLPETERNKILNQRTRDAKKAMDKAEREATRATAKALRETTVAIEKEAKKAEKPGKSKAIREKLVRERGAGSGEQGAGISSPNFLEF
jgi:hypothetical protein